LRLKAALRGYEGITAFKTFIVEIEACIPNVVYTGTPSDAFPDKEIDWYSQETVAADFSGFSDDACGLPVTVTVKYDLAGSLLTNLPPIVLYDPDAKEFSFGKCDYTGDLNGSVTPGKHW
jgi:hypothetical protein